MTEGVEWDVTYDPDLGRNVIMIDTGDTVIYLTKEDLADMLSSLD